VQNPYHQRLPPILSVSANATTSFIIGCTLNGALIWLIRKHSPTELRTYSRVLLQVTLLNIAYSTSIALFGPVQLASAQGSLNYGVGWLARTNDGRAETRFWNCFLHATWVYMMFLTQFTVIVPFLFRYFALCPMHVLSGTAYGAILAVTAVVTACFFFSYYILSGVRTDTPSAALLIDLYLLDSLTAGPQATTITCEALASVTLPSNTMQGIHLKMQYTLFATCYIIVIACSLAIFLHLRRAFAQTANAGVTTTTRTQESRRSQSRQINATLLVEAAIPLVFDFLRHLPHLRRHNPLPHGGAGVQPTHLCPGCDVDDVGPVGESVILVVRPYRRAIFKGGDGGGSSDERMTRVEGNR